jgi:hypothetical protein
VRYLKRLNEDIEIIVSDGDDRDDTIEKVNDLATVIQSPRDRDR